MSKEMLDSWGLSCKGKFEFNWAQEVLNIQVLNYKIRRMLETGEYDDHIFVLKDK